MSEKPMCGPAGSIQTRQRPMCGPKPGSDMWRKMIQRDIRQNNLIKARKVKAEQNNKEKKEKDV